MSGQKCVCVPESHSFCTFKYLDDGLVLVNLNNTSQLLFIAAHGHFHDFIVAGAADTFQDHQRSVDCT